MYVMRIPEKFITVLKLIYPRLLQARGNAGAFPWAITGSLGMALQGMELVIHDIDLQTDQAGAYAIQALLHEMVITPVYLRESQLANSYFGAFEIAGVTVEVMGDYRHRLTDGSWAPAPVLADLIRWVSLDNMRLPVIDLEHECTAYRLLGRVEKSQAIRRFLEENKPRA